MFERFTVEAREVVVVAQERARQLGHDYIGTEHLLLALVANRGIAGIALASLGVQSDAVEAVVIEMVGAGSGRAGGQIPFTPRAKKVLELSLRAALALQHDHIGSEHLLLAVAEEGEGVAIAALQRLGVDSASIRDAVAKELPPGTDIGPLEHSVQRRVSFRRRSASVATGQWHTPQELEQLVLRELERLAHRADIAAGQAADQTRSAESERAYISGALAMLVHLGLLTAEEHEQWRQRLLGASDAPAASTDP